MSIRWRAIANGILVLLFAWSALPSFVSKETREASAWLPNKAMVWGLDLQGGIHWLLRVDEKAVAVQEAKSLGGVLEAEAEDRKLPMVSQHVRDDGVLELEGDATILRGLVGDALSEVEVSEAGGKLEVRASEARNAAAVKRAVQQSIEVLRRRIDDLGVREPLIAPHGDDRILVQMPGADIDPEQAAQALRKATFLEFKPVLDVAPNEELLRAKHAEPDGLGDKQIVFERDAIDNKIKEALLVPKDAVLTGDMLEDARVAFDRRNKPIIEFTWNREGARIFGEFTGEHVGDRLAAIIDGEVVTSPTIKSRIRRNGMIEGTFTQEEAARVAASLRSGSLPIPLIIEEERTVGPALGQDAIEAGRNSLILGSILVVVFMAAYYSVSGWIANVTLIVNLVLILGLMSLLGATLTLPGIAGLVLTVGMAVDSNVIIYERIREELRKKTPIKTAVAIGFDRSALTILDANVTTLFSALILLWLGSGPVQGYQAGPYLLDPFYHTANERRAGVFRMRELAPDRFFSSEYYRTYYVQTGLAEEIGFFITADDDITIVLSLMRREKTGPFPPAEFALLKKAEPLIANMVRHYWAGLGARFDAQLHSRVRGNRKRDASGSSLQPAEAVWRDLNLTSRETAIVDLVLQGHSSESIGLKLNISTGTVKVHRRNVYRKLGISSQTQLLSLYLKNLS